MAQEQRALVRNAADEGQVRNAGRLERKREEVRRANLLETLGSPAGRAALMDVLEDCGIYRSIWHPSALIHYNAGMQDLGHKIQSRILEASEELYELMEREARARRRMTEREIDATHQSRATEGA